MNTESPIPKRRRPFLAFILGGLSSLLLLVAGILIWAIWFGGADKIAGYLFRHRHPPPDAEHAPTIVSYPPGADVAAVIGGKGLGLDCSIPWPGGKLMFERGTGARQAPVELQFRQACVFHDLCYRHGLATYGYTQADCDSFLQEHASRICKQISPEQSWAQCHSDARKVLLGVSLGGTEAFQGWWTSTFHEFDPVPRSREFNVSRLVRENPAANPLFNDRARMVTFNVRPSGVRMAEPGIAPVVLPLRQRRTYSAPFVHTSGDTDRLLWFLRTHELDTAVMLTSGTLGDHQAAASARRLKEFETDILAASPILMRRSAWSEPWLGLTRQTTLSRRLELCGTHAASGRKDQRKCMPIDPAHDMRSNTTYADGDYSSKPATDNPDRLFQSTPLVTDDHLIVLKRGVTDDGTNYHDAADAFVFDLAKLGTANPDGDIVTRVIPDLPIRERDEPVAALPDGASTPVLLSFSVSDDSTASLHETELKVKSERKKAALRSPDKELVLESSWIDRPALLLKPARGETTPTAGRLVLSRAQLAEAESKGEDDHVNLDVLVLGRSNGIWNVELGAQCRVTYTQRRRDVLSSPCQRSALDKDHARLIDMSTAVTRLMGAQLVAGYPAAAGGLTIALPDRCFSTTPIVLDGKLDAKNPLSPGNLVPRRTEESGPEKTKRIIACDRPLTLKTAAAGASKK